MDITGIITKELQIERWQAEAVIRLIDEGNTIPFIARYRKEAHGNLNDAQLRTFDERLQYLRNLEERKETVAAAIDKQGKLTDELKRAIDEARTAAEVEDLYRPYKQRRRTRATIAREAGLEPLAAYILSADAGKPVEQEARKYIRRPDTTETSEEKQQEKSVPDVATAISMAEDIIAEQVSDDAGYRDWIRRLIWKEGLLVSGRVGSRSTGSTSSKAAAGSTAGVSSKGSAGIAAKASGGRSSGNDDKAVGKTHNRKLEERESIYENYYDFSEPLARIPGHRVLAINRGEKEKFLSVHIEAPQEKIIDYLFRQENLREAAPAVTRSRADTRTKTRPVGASLQDQLKNLRLNDTRQEVRNGTTAHPSKVTGRKMFRENPVTSRYIREAVTDAWKRLIGPSIETEIRNDLTERAEEGAIKVFASNLEQLLMQPPVTGRVVLGWDPAFRTGCKLAVVDETGKVLDTTVIYPTEPQNKVKEAKETLRRLYDRYHYTLISCGNGTASRESEQVIAAFIRESGLPIQYVITNEAGASVYSASELATQEFPNFDVGQRSAASIARRVQDPLAELVKIDPKAIGVGQYQHDMNQARLDESLTGVVEDCVNRVGVDVNTASAALLSYISGVNRTIAKNMVAWREQNGRFENRRDFMKVKGLGAKAFEQCAGFLRIRDGSEPLDQTAVHPESYDAARKLLSELDYTREDVAAGRTGDIEKRATASLAQLSKDTGLGEYTLKDVLSELEKPGRDPRKELAGPVLRSDVLSIKDLKPDMVLKGTVRNIVDFGAFVDIGVHQDGLVHISQLSDSYVKHPLDVVKVGDIVNVKVLSVDEKRGRISLTMRL